MLADAFSFASAMPARISSTPAIGPLLLGTRVDAVVRLHYTRPDTQCDQLTLSSKRGPGNQQGPERRNVRGLAGGGGYRIRTCEGVNPTRFPSVRLRPLGQSSA